MSQIVIDAAGPLKADLVTGAYEFCGLNGQEYERSPEEMTTGLKRLNALMASLKTKGIDLGFDFPNYGLGLLEEPSGIPDEAAEPVTLLLAQRLSPSLGGSLSDDAKAVLAQAAHDLYANYAATPPSMIPASRMSSSGVRHGRLGIITSSEITGDPGDLGAIIVGG